MYDDTCEKMLVSACLAGFSCRYDGGCKADDRIVRLVREGRAIPACPEQLGGLSTPRSPAEIRKNDGAVMAADGRDVTAAFQKGAKEALRICRLYGLKKALLKARSPSCGVGSVYDGTFSGTLTDGDGVTAALLAANGILVETVE